MTSIDPQASLSGTERDSLAELQKTLGELVKNVVSAQSEIDQISKSERRRFSPVKSAEILDILGPAIEHVSGLETTFNGLLEKSQSLRKEFVNKVVNLESGIVEGINNMGSLKLVLETASKIANDNEVSNGQNKAHNITLRSQGTQTARHSQHEEINHSTSTSAREGHADPYLTPPYNGTGVRGESTFKGKKRPASDESPGSEGPGNHKKKKNQLIDKPTQFEGLSNKGVPEDISKTLFHTFGTPPQSHAEEPPLRRSNRKVNRQ